MSKRRSTEGVAEFPTRQLFILSLCRISESVAFMSIFPYVYYMIASFKIAEGDHQIAIYAGMVTSAFTLAEFSTGVMWGRLSDRIGRKPVLLIGFAGTGLSMLIFGFATNLTVALIGRAVGGFLNGNMGVLATSVAEMITVKEHQRSIARAYAVMPFVWSLGSILGPALGGALAEPCNNYPNIFHRGTIFDKFPYLLPNLVCAMFIVCGVVIGLLFLEETHELKKHQRDLGLELGDWILRKIRYYISWCKAPSTNQSKVAESSWDEHQVLLFDEETQDSTPTPPTSQLSLAFSEEMPIPSCKKSFTRPVVLHIIAFALLA
ncbi:MAG: hypothetical protein M1829_003948 [Trizodia sp. TS-e1964]|nr:MAG: hypothetical protein M1829_003948 [Trizodia sp. TS-e1964]